jgi:hypothetical protein
MDVFHSHLESVEASGLWNLNLCHESLSQIFKNNSVRSSKESKNMLDKMFFVIIELLPIFQILSQVNFFSSPEASHLLFIHFPDVVVLDRKDNESAWVLFEQRLWQHLSESLCCRLLSWSFAASNWNLKSSMLGLLILN